MNNGRSIFLALQAKDLELEASATDSNGMALTTRISVFPTQGQFRSSTEYFKFAMTNGWMEGFDFTYFWAPGLPSVENPTNADSFSAENNAWCVVEGTREFSHTPFLFTRNIRFTGPTIDTFDRVKFPQAPLSMPCAVVISRTGAGRVIGPRGIKKKLFCEPGEMNGILWP